MTAQGSLAGRRIVVTRSRAQAGALRGVLEAEGADVIECPTIRVAAPADLGPLDRALAQLPEYRWVVFTSQNGVAAFVDRLEALGRDLRVLGASRVAAIGPATARALESRGFGVALSPAEFVAEALVDAFKSEDVQGVRMLLPRAAGARSVLPDGLRALGAVVDVVPAYRIELERGQGPDVWRQLIEGRVDAVTFTSSSTVRNFVDLLGRESSRLAPRTLVACIGPITAATARDCGLRVDIVARVYTVHGLVAALRERLGRAVPVADRSEEVPR